MRRLQEQSYLKAKQAAAMAQKLNSEEKGDISKKTNVNVVTLLTVKIQIVTMEYHSWLKIRSLES